jgi:hypothetical protein
MGVPTVIGLTMGDPERFTNMRSLLIEIANCDVTILTNKKGGDFPIKR